MMGSPGSDPVCPYSKHGIATETFPSPPVAMILPGCFLRMYLDVSILLKSDIDIY